MSAVKLHLFKKTKILIIEDNSALRKVLTDNLSDEGYEVLGAEEGVRGYEMAIAEHPDLILLDMMLPGMDGISVLKSLRRDEWGATAKVIACTNLMQGQALSKEFDENHVAGYIEKVNLTLEGISQKIKEVLTKKQ
jgi:CheY-like chemotaxis protein